ncbi:hypothetical protein E3U23_05525 [Erythrobacter litoralis]|uniref:hypothetical protein n=1 Tax=Erythrobacter litoralis TaxID=39960 RepID=UPI0024357A86|nr:hypothetical protein [Erythrobacter litoralis]MDG6078652.1 hypothetical protein [Erythrobacter litoralis]
MVARFCLPLCALALTACGSQEPEGEPATRLETAGRYDIDPATGSVSAEHVDPEGVVTRLKAGENLPAALPEPFVAYPGAEVLHNTRVEQADARLVYLDFETVDTPREVIAFYRELAAAAGITPNVDVPGSESLTLGGENAALQLTFSINARREGNVTQAQLVVGKGF